MAVKVHEEHKAFIRDLFREGFTLLELHQMYEGFITYGQLRYITGSVKRNPQP